MASDLAPGDSNTPWWYETPSLVSQSTHLEAFTSSNESNPFDITPSVSSGYYEDEGSIVSDGSYPGHFSGTAGGQLLGGSSTRSESSWMPLSNGRQEHHQVLTTDGVVLLSATPESTLNVDSTCTLVESDLSNNFMDQQPQQPWGGGGGREGPGKAASKASGRNYTAGHDGFGSLRSRGGVPVAPLKPEGEKPLSKAFGTPTKAKGDIPAAISTQQQHYRQDYENAMSSTNSSSGVDTSSPLSHSMSATNREILHYLAPQLMQNICSIDLLPHLKRHNLLTDSDIDFIYDPQNHERDKVKRILLTAPSRDSEAFERFVACFETDGSHSKHMNIARRLRDAIERKKMYPFKRLSSLRGKGQSSHRSNHTSHSSMGRGAEQTTPKTTPHHKRLEWEEPGPPQVPPKQRRQHKKTLSNGGQPVSQKSRTLPSNLDRMDPQLSQSMDPMFVIEDSSVQHTPAPNQGYLPRGPRQGYDKVRYHPAPGNYSSLPRTASQESVSRGTKPYSSARFSSSTYIKPSGTPEKKKSSLSRNSSFQGPADRHIIVSPLDKNPAILSEDTEDDSYLFRKASLVSDTTQGANYENIFRKTSEDSVRSYTSAASVTNSSSNYQNLPIGSAILGFKKAVSLPRGRTHAAIPEDPTHPMDQALESTVEDIRSTFPRRVPSRTQSLHVHADSNMPPKVPPHRSGSADRNEMSPREKGLCLRRGASLHGPADAAFVGSRRNVSSPSVGAQYPGAVRRGSSSSEADDKVVAKPSRMGVAELVPPTAMRQHRRTHSLEGSKVTEGASSAVSRRGVSEYYPEEREEEQRDRETEKRQDDISNISASALDAQAMGMDANQQKMFQKKIQWLQQKIKFTDFSEEVHFDSQTRYNTPRSILYSGTLYEKGKPRFVILLTDMLLILKPKKKAGKIGHRQMQFIDWFTEIACKAKRPLMLHLLSIQGKSHKASSDSFGLHYNKGSSLVKINFSSVSKEAKDIWLDNLTAAITACTRANAECTVPVRRNVGRALEGRGQNTLLSLTIVEANNIAYSANVTTKNHYCTIVLGELHCRTPSVKAKCWPTWNYRCDFTNFDLNDVLRINFFTERICSPDDFLGYVEVNLYSASQKHHNQLGMTEMQLKKQHLPLRDGKGTLTVDFDLKWGDQQDSS